MFPLVFPLVISLAVFVFFAGSAPFVKDRPSRVPPYIKTGMPYLILNVGAALRASRDLLDDPMPFVARPWIRPQWFAIGLEPRCM